MPCAVRCGRPLYLAHDISRGRTRAIGQASIAYWVVQDARDWLLQASAAQRRSHRGWAPGRSGLGASLCPCRHAVRRGASAMASCSTKPVAVCRARPLPSAGASAPVCRRVATRALPCRVFPPRARSRSHGVCSLRGRGRSACQVTRLAWPAFCRVARTPCGRRRSSLRRRSGRRPRTAGGPRTSPSRWRNGFGAEDSH
jgi:hypothetical protein